MDPTAIAESLHRVKGNGTNQAFYETFQPNQASASPVDAIKAFGPDTGLSVRLSPSRSGPPFLQFGIDGTAMNSNVSRTTLDFRLLNTDLGGFGSELRTDVRVGFLTQVSTEYYRLLSHSGYFLQPQVGYVRQPVYLWADQKRISEHLGQQAGGGFEAGRTFSRNLQASFSYQNQVVRWHPVTGDDGTVPVSGDAQTATFHLAFDNTQSGVFAVNRGLHDVRIDLRAGALFHTTQSENAPFLQASVRKPFHFGRNQLLLLSADANSYAKRNVTEPLRFTVGGPQRLSASSIDEFRGTDNYLMRAGFARKLSALPAGYGQGLYGAFAYEAAEVWSPEKPAFLRQDGVVTIIGILPVGAVTLGGSVGDASHRKIFITFGRLF